MSIYLRIFVLMTAIALLVFIVNMVKRRKLSEKDSLLWILAGLVILSVTLFPQLPDNIARILGLYYSAAILFFVGIVFALFIIIYHSTRLSDLTEKNKELAQKIGILENYVKEKAKKEESRMEK